MKIRIAGAGVGGLTAALSLHAAGFEDVQVLEGAREIREIGVGINLPPHAVRELVELGLAEELAAIGLPTSALSYYDRAGQLIWAEPRGLGAGYRWPQYSVHRGRLQHILLEAVRARLGPDAVRTGKRVVRVEQRNDRQVEVAVLDVATDHIEHLSADLLIGADGIRSAVRTSLLGAEVPLASNGWVMYRGAARSAPFLGGSTMVIAGDEAQRVVVYPLDKDTLNWLMVRPMPEGVATGDLGNWNRPVDVAAIAEQVAGWKFDWLNIPELIRSTETVYEYPMADIDPLPQWSFGRATLLGDAAHAMYPFGSNGASQAILDARVLAYELSQDANVVDALRRYENARRETVAKVQLANRRQAGDVMSKVAALARANSHDAAMEELKSVEQAYKQMAGFDVETLNQRASWSVGERPEPR